jgi:GT2 family glycosyltransferase
MESHIERFGRADGQPLVSIVVLNCNGANWLPKCFGSIKTQTILTRIELVMVDNNSSDDSVAVARKWFADFPNALIVRNSENLGFCEGNNSGARAATGKWLLFLNNDTWLEPDCMEKLVAGTEKLGAAASTPLVLNYPDNSYFTASTFSACPVRRQWQPARARFSLPADARISFAPTFSTSLACLTRNISFTPMTPICHGACGWPATRWLEYSRQSCIIAARQA